MIINFVTRIFQLLILISPIVITADVNMDIYDIVIFRTGSIALFVASLLDTKKRELPIWIRNLAIGMFGLCLFNIYNHHLDPNVMSTTLNTFLAIIAFCIVFMYLDINMDLKKFILGAVAINFGFFVLQHLGYDPVFDNSARGSALYGGLIGNLGRFSTYIALITPFLPLWFLPLIILFGLWIGQYSVFVPVIIIFFSLRFHTLKSRILFYLIGLAGIMVLYSHIKTSVNVRIYDAWLPVLKAYFDRPFVGCGLGINPIPGSNLGVILNSYIQLITGLGALAMIWLGYAFKKLWHFNPGMPLKCLLGIMFIEYPIELPRFWFLIIVILVVSLIKKGANADVERIERKDNSNNSVA